MSVGNQRKTSSEIYGLIVCGAVLATGSYYKEHLELALALLVTLGVYWAAETYAHVLAVLSERPGRLSRAEFGRIARTGLPMIGASFIPLMALLAAWALGADVVDSARFGLLVTTWMLFVVGWLTGRRSGFSGWRQVAATLLPGLLGLILILLKFQLH